MRTENISLLSAAGPTPGPWRAFGDWDKATVQVSGYVSSIQLQVSNDKLDITNVTNHQAAIVANGVYDVATGYRWIRATGVGNVQLNARTGC